MKTNIPVLIFNPSITVSNEMPAKYTDVYRAHFEADTQTLYYQDNCPDWRLEEECRAVANWLCAKYGHKDPTYCVLLGNYISTKVFEAKEMTNESIRSNTDD